VEGGREGPAVAAIYRERLAARRAAEARLEAKHVRFSWARLALFFSGVALVVALGAAAAPWLSLPILAFVPLAIAHARTLNARDRAARAAAFYERGLARLEDRWQGGGLRGERFRDARHLYADDLDVFGEGSLFELIATVRTDSGEDVLAGWLLAPATLEEIRQRQTAIDELAGRLDLREGLAVLGPEIQAGVRTKQLAAWATAPRQLHAIWPQIVAPLLAAVSTTCIVWWIWTGAPPAALVPSIVVQSVFAGAFRRRVHEVSHAVEERERELEVLASLMQRLEGEPASAPLLIRLQTELKSTGRSPSEEIRRLARLADVISSTHNQFFGPIAALLLLGTQLAFAVERWRARCGPAVPRWLRAIAEYEALSALGTYRSEHPSDPFPEIIDDTALFEADSIAHPLLSSAAAIPNDVRLGNAHPHLLVVSGSNMSGKSTLLRTVGLNAVLAQAGAPVRAKRLRMSRVAIGATLRLQDSLQEGRSRFFAEITRISEIVAIAKRDRETPAVLFLFDELLSGTNSHDRLEGSTGILTGLIDLRAIGLVTTHDLALAAIADRLGDKAKNVHFEDKFEDGVLSFDYRLRDGVVRTGNAIPLMRSVGLDV
jgi:MutS domain V